MSCWRGWGRNVDIRFKAGAEKSVVLSHRRTANEITYG